MAASDHPQGYQCDFIDSVPEDFYCKKCALVARRLIFTGCCEESYSMYKPCPACEQEAFTTVELMKYQKKVNQLQVYCSMKERGCDWSGTLEQLDTHLDPDQDNCQYVDTKCPLNCHMTIPKNKVEQHVAQHCAKRPYVCQHCNFKATYEEVVDTHLPECKYFPLQCPNLCGVTFERDFMEDHMKMCHLQEVECEFSGVGCDGRFRQEDQEEHTSQNSQKHLTLTASLAVETKERLQQSEQKLLEQDKKHKEEEEKHLTLTASLAVETKEQLQQKLLEQDKKHKEEEEKHLTLTASLAMETKEQLQQKLLEQDKKHKEEEEKLMHKMEEQEKKIEEQEKRLIEQEKKLNEHQTNLNDGEKRFQDQNRDHKEEKKMLKQILEEQGERQKELEQNFLKLSHHVSFNRRFKMESFSKEKAKDVISDWKSPAMYTHVCGYKFCIGVDANGNVGGRGKSINVDIWCMPGEFDGQLKWPAKAKITIELVNQQGGENATCTTLVDIERHDIPHYLLACFERITIDDDHAFLEHSLLYKFLINDTLHFHVSEMHLL